MKTAGRKRGRPPECPACRGQRTVAIIYGMPSGEIFEAVARGETPGAAIGRLRRRTGQPPLGLPGLRAPLVEDR